jgi:membrane-bound lytic murein transglycosylase D
LQSIALQHHTTTTLIKELNDLKKATVTPGQSLILPHNLPLPKTVAQKIPKPIKPFELEKKRVIHIVQATDTFQHLEKLYGVLTSEIRAWNKLANLPLKEGQQLVIWKNSATSSEHKS